MKTNAEAVHQPRASAACTLAGRRCSTAATSCGATEHESRITTCGVNTSWRQQSADLKIDAIDLHLRRAAARLLLRLSDGGEPREQRWLPKPLPHVSTRDARFNPIARTPEGAPKPPRFGRSCRKDGEGLGTKIGVVEAQVKKAGRPTGPRMPCGWNCGV